MTIASAGIGDVAGGHDRPVPKRKKVMVADRILIANVSKHGVILCHYKISEMHCENLVFSGEISSLTGRRR